MISIYRFPDHYAECFCWRVEGGGTRLVVFADAVSRHTWIDLQEPTRRLHAARDRQLPAVFPRPSKVQQQTVSQKEWQTLEINGINGSTGKQPAVHPRTEQSTDANRPWFTKLRRIKKKAAPAASR